MSVSATLGGGGGRLWRGARRRPPQCLAVEGDRPPAGGGRHQINGRAGGKSPLGGQPTDGPAGDRRVQRGGSVACRQLRCVASHGNPPCESAQPPPRRSSTARPRAAAPPPIPPYEGAPVRPAALASTPA